MRKKRGKRVPSGRTALSPSQKIAIIVAVIALLILLALPFREFLVGKAGEGCNENTFPYTIGLSSGNAEQTITFLDGSTCVVLTARVLTNYLIFTNYLNILYNGASLPLTDSGDVNVFISLFLAGGELSLDYNADGTDDLTMNFLSVDNGYPVIRFERIGVETPPAALTVALTSDRGERTNSPFTVTATFSTVVTGFGLDDIEIVNAGVSSLSPAEGTSTYTFTVTPLEEGLVTVTIPANAAQDDRMNSNAAASLSIFYDTTLPTVTLGASAPDETGAFVVTASFSERVFDFDLRGVQVSGATISALESSEDGFTYTFRVTPSGGDAPFNITITIPAGAALDAAGNGNAASLTLTRTYETERPTVTLTADSLSVSRLFVVRADFSEQVYEFGQGDIELLPAGAAEIHNFSGDGQNYAITITPLEEGGITIQIPASAVHDAAGNRNIAPASLSVTYDRTAPTAILSTTAQDTINTLFTITINFNEDVTSFDRDDIVISDNARVGQFIGSGAVYGFQVIPSEDGLVTITIPANATRDAAGNWNEESYTLSKVFDETPPTVELTHNSNPDSERFGVFHFRAAFSEQVTDFAQEDITINPSSAAVSGFSGSGRFYSFTVSATGGTFSITVPANAASDAAGNGNTASDSLTINYAVPTPSQLAIIVRNPNTEAAQQKTITASVSGGILEQAVNGPEVDTCGNMLTFLAYSTLTFRSEADNGKTVCYKATEGETSVYSLSKPIRGIDRTPPAITVPQDMVVPATRPQGIVLNFAHLIRTEEANFLNCNPASGSLFPFGETTVGCLAMDTAGNNAGGSFTVTVPRRGDIGGDDTLGIGDLSLLLRHLGRDTTLPRLSGDTLHMANTDCDARNEITISDISILARAIANRHQGVACP